MTKKVLELVKLYQKDYFNNINLVASENIMSPDVLYAIGSDLTNRYLIPPEDERPKALWEYPHQKYPREIAKVTADYAKKLYFGKYANVAPLSGNNAVFIVIKSLVPQGGKILRVPARFGGHFTTEEICLRENITPLDIPYNEDTQQVDIQKLKELYDREKPELLIFDASMILFPHPVKEVREALGEDIIISYDASHVFGLIGGGEFQSPLTEGADLIHGSVHKSLFGPQKGMIICKENGEIAQKIDQTVCPLFVSNAHPHHIAGLGIALEEIMEYGSAYAKQVIKNAKTFSHNLDSMGFDVICKNRGYTESHMVICSIGDKEKTFNTYMKLERIGINLNVIRVPFTDVFGFRIGFGEVTRRGFKEQDMEQIADLIKRSLTSEETEESLAEEIKNLSHKFTGIAYFQN